MQESTTYLIIIGAVVVALAALAALVNYVMSIVRGVQEMRHAGNPPRNPPLPEELAKDYATKREVDALKKETNGKIAELKDDLNGEIAELKRGISDEIAELKRGVSAEIAGLKNEIMKERERADASLREQYNLIRELTSKTNDWQQSVNLMLGRIEGKVNRK